MKPWLIALGALVVISAGALVVLKALRSPASEDSAGHTEGHDSTSTPDTSQAVETTAVSYSDDGFSPSVIRVKRGTTVSFTNDSSEPLQTASGPHPTHNAYPEFDGRAPIKSGEVYRFTFTKPGTWGYHNHFNDDHIGTVVVE